MNISNEIKILEQIVKEDRVSKRNLWDILKRDSGIPDGTHQRMVRKIKEYLEEDYWNSKKDRIKTLVMNLDIDELIVNICAAVFYEAQNLVPIHPVLNRLANSLEYLEGIDAIKCAAEIIEVLDGTVLKLHRKTTLSIESLYTADSDLLDLIKDLKAMEPMSVEPVNWTSTNNGGYFTHKTHVILGSQKSYSKPIAYDVLNKLQKVSTSVGHFVWRYDSRGRVYSTGYIHNFQGGDEARSKVELSNKYQLGG